MNGQGKGRLGLGFTATIQLSEKTEGAQPAQWKDHCTLQKGNPGAERQDSHTAAAAAAGGGGGDGDGDGAAAVGEPDGHEFSSIYSSFYSARN